MARHNLTASRITFFAVLVVVGGLFGWWIKKRPSYLIYQTSASMGEKNQAAAVAEYKRLLKKKKLPVEEEIRLRLALGDIYLSAVPEAVGVEEMWSSYGQAVEHPFLETARQEFKRVVAISTGSADAHLGLARIYFIRKMEAYAMEEIEAAGKLSPDNPRVPYLRGLVKYDRGEFEASRDFALQVLAGYPAFDKARLLLMNSYSRLGKADRAIEEYGKLSEGLRGTPRLRAQYALYLAGQNFWTASESEIMAAVAAAPSDVWVKSIYGQIQLMRRDLDAAAATFQQCAQLMPDNWWMVYFSVKAAFERGDCARVTREADRLLLLEIRWPYVHVMEAYGHLCRGDENRALDALDDALQIGGRMMDVILFRARLLADRADWGRLGIALRPLLDEKTDNSEAYSLLSESLYAQGKAALAIEAAETAIQYNTRNAWAFLWLGLARHEKGDTEGAARAVQQAVEMNPHDTALMAYQAFWLYRKGQYATSLRSLEDIVRGDPRQAVAWRLLGDIHRLKKNLPEAVRAYDEAILAKPYLFDARIGRAESLALMGERSAALSELALASKLNGTSTRVLALRRSLGSR